jgi:hypothetical protein
MEPDVPVVGKRLKSIDAPIGLPRPSSTSHLAALDMAAKATDA